jgi:hypothetical protein
MGLHPKHDNQVRSCIRLGGHEDFAGEGASVIRPTAEHESIRSHSFLMVLWGLGPCFLARRRNGVGLLFLQF